MVSGSGIVGSAGGGSSASYNDLGIAWFMPGDRPLATARFYVKDIVINFYR